MNRILILFLIALVLIVSFFLEPVQSASSSNRKKTSSSSTSKSSSSSGKSSSSSSSKYSSLKSSTKSEGTSSSRSKSSKSSSPTKTSSKQGSSSKNGARDDVNGKTSKSALLKSSSSSKRPAGSSAPLSKQPSSSLATGSDLMVRYGRKYSAGDDLLWRIDHNHGTPNTPSWYLHFFELKYLWPFVESLGKYLWLDSSPLHMTPSSSSKTSQEAPQTYVTAPLYTLCDMLPIQSRVACVATSQDVPQCSSKKTFVSQIEDIRDKNYSACFHSPVMTNRSKIARQRYELLRDPHVRVDFHASLKQLYQAFEVSYKTYYTDHTDKNFTSVRSITPATGTTPIGNGTLIRINRLAHVLNEVTNPSRFVVVHWQCASYASESLSLPHPAHKLSSVANAGRRKLATSSGSRSSISSSSSKSKTKPKPKVSSKSSPNSQPAKSSALTPTSSSKKFSLSQQGQNANQQHQTLLAQCAKEFDGLLKFIDRERRMIWSVQKNATAENALFPKNHWQWMIVVTPPQDEMFATLRLSDWKKHLLLEQQLKQPQLLASSMSVSSPFFTMLRRRLRVFEASKSNVTITSANDRFPPLRLSRDVVQELWPKLKEVAPIAHKMASQVHTRNDDIHTTAKVSSTNISASNIAVDVPSMVEIHALEAQLMVNAKVFYGMAQGNSLVQDVIDSERYLRQDRSYCFFVTPQSNDKHNIVKTNSSTSSTVNMVFPLPLDRQSWCYAATSPRAKPKNEMVKYP